MNTKIYLKLFIIIVFGFGIGSGTYGIENSTSLKVSISNVILDNNNVTLDLCFKNTSSKEIFLEKLNFPFEGVLARNLFAVRKNDESNSYVKYVGRVVNAGNLLNKDNFIKLSPKESKTIKIRLSDFYNFNDSSAVYSIRYDSENKSLMDQNHFEILKSNILTLAPEGRKLG